MYVVPCRTPYYLVHSPSLQYILRLSSLYSVFVFTLLYAHLLYTMHSFAPGITTTCPG